jgi:uncharacterized membrane protein
MNSNPDMLLFLGRSHPLAVHLPIGFLVLLAVLETLSHTQRFRRANASASYILALLAPAAVVTAATGWMLSGSGDYEGRVLQIHRWLGVCAAVLCVLLTVLHRLQWRRTYTVCLYTSVSVLMVTGHWGGSLTHGRDYLVQYAPRIVRKAFSRPGTALTGPAGGTGNERFEAVVAPMLQARCGACHNREKHKGGLSVDTFEGLLSGGVNGPAIVIGDAAKSPLIERMLLPLDHEDHMPPKGKPQPRPEQIELLRRWIDGGAGRGSTTNADALLGGTESPFAIQERRGTAGRRPEL